MYDIDYQLTLNTLYEDLSPMGKKRVAVVLGRFQPPTAGHYEVIKKVIKFIKSNPNLGLEFSPVVVVIGGSKSDDDHSRNPLSVSDRINFMKASGNTNGVVFLTASNAFTALSSLRDQGYEPIAVAAGSDRIDDYLSILNKHFKKPDGTEIKHYKIELPRDENAVLTKKGEKSQALDAALNDLHKDGDISTDIISGSLARRAVELGYEKEFAEIVGLAHKPELAKKMFSKIKSSMKE